MKTHIVANDDVRLHVVTAGDPSHPPVIFLHGFPDNHKTWEKQYAALKDKYYVIGYDMRGVGLSSAPSKKRKAYLIEKLMSDLNAVADQVLGAGVPFHLVGHDWGSVIGWSYITDDHYAKRVLSYSSISGPHLALMLNWAKRHIQSGETQLIKQAIGQVASSWYVYLINVPGLSEFFIKRVGLASWREVLSRNGIPYDDDYLDITQSQLEKICLNATNLYRQNPLSPPPMPLRKGINVPVQLLIPEDDPFIRQHLYCYYDEYVKQLTKVSIEGSHWVHHGDAENVNQYIVRFMQQNEPKKLKRAG